MTLARHTPLKRSRWGVSRGPSRRVKRKTDEEKTYTAWVHTQRCHVWFISDAWLSPHLAGKDSCAGRVEQSHLRHHTGLGRKESDLKSVPMCSRHHGLWERRDGPFRGLTNLQRFALMSGWIAECHEAYAQPCTRGPGHPGNR